MASEKKKPGVKLRNPLAGPRVAFPSRVEKQTLTILNYIKKPGERSIGETVDRLAMENSKEI